MPIINSNILDYALAQTGTIESLFELALLNDIGITENVAAGEVVDVPAKKYFVQPVEVEAFIPVPEYVLKQRQTVVDFACQYSGTMESLFELALLNGVSLTQDVAPGTALKAVPVDLKTVDYYAASVLDIVTDKTVNTMPGGIGYMQIGSSFKVS